MKTIPRIAALTLLVLAPLPLHAQPVTLEHAASLAAEGRLEAALATYDQLHRLDPTDVAVRLGRGHVLAWLGRDDDAQAAFADVLAQDATNLSALLGVAFNHAWRGRYDDARAGFEEVLALEPGFAEAQRGLAFVAQWSGRHSEALERFGRLLESDPGNADLALALAQTHLSAGQPRAARAGFLRVLELAPTRAEARAGLEAASRTPSQVELSVWAGYTSFAGAAAPSDLASDRFGVRSARLAVRASPSLTLWGMVDDGLSYDNRALAGVGEHVPSYTGGAQILWGGRFLTRVEGGRREVATVGQRLASVEQVVLLPSSVALKAGLWLGVRDDERTERVAHLGVSIAATPRLTVESLAFLSSAGLPDGDGSRGVVVADYRFANGWTAGGGLAYGRTGIGLDRTTDVAEGHASVSAPILDVHRVHATVRHQRLADADGITMVALGFSLGVWGR
jgi:tetratricopeptide (TPR) repeat protein